MDWNELYTLIKKQGVQLFSGILVLIVGLFLAHWIIKLTEKRLKFQRLDPTARGFLHNLLRLLLYVAVVLAAAGVMGIPLTSFVTILASAGVAVSLAMQGALGNLVGGITLLLLKPIKAGDYVKVGDFEGTVQTVGAFYTEMTTFDNRHISMPNSSLTNTAIINFTREGTRRLDKVFSVSYDSDIETVFSTLRELAARCPGVLSQPPAAVYLTELAESGINFTVRVWCRNADYWDINFYLLEEGKKALDQAGITIPYPQVDVHIKSC